MTDKTTATERLRRLLDEREVDWEAWNDRITVALPDKHYLEITNGTICAVMVDCNPEQAVEATLGRGTCGNVSDFPKYEFVCSECGCRLDIVDEFDNQTIQHADGSFGPRFCPSCGRKVEQ